MHFLFKFVKDVLLIKTIFYHSNQQGFCSKISVNTQLILALQVPEKGEKIFHKVVQ